MRIADMSQSGADQWDIQSMLKVEAITDDVCSGLRSSESEKLEVKLDIWNDRLEGLHHSVLGGLLDGVLGSEQNHMPEYTCVQCDWSLGRMTCHSTAMIKIGIPIEVNWLQQQLFRDESEANRPERRVTGHGGHHPDMIHIHVDKSHTNDPWRKRIMT
jgi:hypothetical protein